MSSFNEPVGCNGEVEPKNDRKPNENRREF